METEQRILLGPPEDYLVDYLREVQLRQGRVPWSAFSARPRNALKCVLAYVGNPKVADSRFFKFLDIQSISIGDLREQTNVGEDTLLDLVHQLNEAFLSLTEGDEMEEKADEQYHLELVRTEIIEHSNLEDLCQAMLKYLVSVHEVSERKTDE